MKSDEWDVVAGKLDDQSFEEEQEHEPEVELHTLEFAREAIAEQARPIVERWLGCLMPHEVAFLPYIFVEVVRRVTGWWMVDDPQASSGFITRVAIALTQYRDERIYQHSTILRVKASPGVVEVEVGDMLLLPGGRTLMDWGDILLPRVVTQVAGEVFGSSYQLQADLISCVIGHLETRVVELLALEKKHQAQQRRRVEDLLSEEEDLACDGGDGGDG